jgi:hypothetical protein
VFDGRDEAILVSKLVEEIDGGGGRRERGIRLREWSKAGQSGRLDARLTRRVQRAVIRMSKRWGEVRWDSRRKGKV